MILKTYFKCILFLFLTFQVSGQGCIDDLTPPVITCSIDIVTENDPGECIANVLVPQPSVSDNCSNDFSLDFDGNDEYVDLNGSITLPNTFTIEAWVYSTSNTGIHNILAECDDPNSPSGCFGQDYNGLFFRAIDGKVDLSMFNYSGGFNGFVYASNTTLPLNTWTHVAATVNSVTKTVSIYFNGEFQSGGLIFNSGTGVSSDSYQPNIAGQNNVFNNVTTYPWSGKLDEIRIWDSLLSQTDIQDRFDSPLSGNEPGLLAYYDFEDGINSSALSDMTINANNGTLTNMDSSNDWVEAPDIFNVTLINDFNGTSDASGDYPIGDTTVTWTATDASGNMATCEQIVTITNTTAPTMTCAADVSGLVGDDIVLTPPTVTDDCTGLGNALNFDGINDYVNAGLIDLTNTHYTFEGWFNSNSSGEDLFSVFDNSGTNRIYNLIEIQNTTGYLRYLHRPDPSQSGVDLYTTFAVNDGLWHHVATVYDTDNKTRLYVDGVLVSTSVGTSTPFLGGMSVVEIGRLNYGGGSRYFSGSLDEIRVWNTARTQAEIQANMNTELNTTPGLVASYHFNEGVANGNNAGITTATDASGNGYDGTLINFALTGATSNWVEGNVLATPMVTNDAPATFAIGDTTVTWTATDVSGNMATCEQMVTIQSPTVTYTYNNGWSPSDPNGVISAEDDIIIETGDAIINRNTNCNSVTVRPGAGLLVNNGLDGTTIFAPGNFVLQSSSTSYSSFILSGSVLNGTIKYERYVNSNTNGNDLICSPVGSLSWQDFLTTASNEADLFDDGNDPKTYAFGVFDKTIGDFVNLNENYLGQINVNGGAGNGFRVATDVGTTLTFEGGYNGGSQTVGIVNSGPIRAEWNLIGNPFPTYLKVQDFLNESNELGGTNPGGTNLSYLKPEAAGIYGYDGSAANGWTIYNLATTTPSTLIAPGQGFFVAAAISAATLSFLPTHQSTGSSDDFIQGRNAELSYLKLKLSSTNETSRTDFYFNNNASQGLDIGYDAEVFDTMNLYSHLLQDNVGQAMALQALNSTDLSDVSIPLGVNANQGEQITFSISESTLPDSVNVYLEDVVTNTSTLLNSGDYVMTPTTNLSGTGRFFLRTSEDALSTMDNNLDTLNIFALNSSKELVVSGQLQDATTLKLYDIQGRLVLSTALDNSNIENRIDVSSLSGGVYVVNVQNNAQQKTQKVVLK